MWCLAISIEIESRWLFAVVVFGVFDGFGLFLCCYCCGDGVFGFGLDGLLFINSVVRFCH